MQLNLKLVSSFGVQSGLPAVYSPPLGGYTTFQTTQRTTCLTSVVQSRILIGLCLVQISALVCAVCLGVGITSCGWLANASQPTIDCTSCHSVSMSLSVVSLLSLGLLLSLLGTWAGYFRHGSSCRFYGWFTVIYCIGVAAYFFTLAVDIPKYRTAMSQTSDDACQATVQDILNNAILLSFMYGLVFLVDLAGAALALHLHRRFFSDCDEKQPFLLPPHNPNVAHV